MLDADAAMKSFGLDVMAAAGDCPEDQLDQCLADAYTKGLGVLATDLSALPAVPAEIKVEHDALISAAQQGVELMSDTKGLSEAELQDRTAQYEALVPPAMDAYKAALAGLVG